MPVSELLDRMSSSELSEWAALFKIEASEAQQQRQMANQRAKRR